MSDEYDAVAKAQDATEFANSRFGKHYIARLKEVRKAYRDQTERNDLSKDEIARAGAMAAAYRDEIEYFTIARTIISDQGLIGTIRDNIKKRLEGKKV